MSDVFISYSRQSDIEFVDRLSAALEARGQEVWVDRAGIFPSSPWRPEIEQAILEAHAFVFVISPSSVASDYCRAELDRATELGKRIVPILASPTPLASIPPELAALHFLSFIDDQQSPEVGGAFERQVDRLVEVLSTDIESLHLQTRLLTQASRWTLQKEDRSLLLRGRELDASERWLDEQNAQGRLILPNQQRLVRESRRAATRRQRGSVGTATVIAIAMALLAVFAFVQRAQAVHQSNIAFGRQLAAESVAESNSSVTEQVLLGLEAYAHSDTTQARSALVGAAEEPLETTLPATIGEVNGVAYDAKGHLLATASVHGAALWSTTTDEMQGRPFDAGIQVNGVAFNPQGTVLATALNNGTVALFTVSSHARDGTLRGDGSFVTAEAFAPDGQLLAGVTSHGTVFLWNLATGRSINASVGSNAGLTSVAFSPDGTTLAVGGNVDVNSGDGVNGFVNIYPTLLESPQTFTEVGNPVDTVAFAPNGRTLAVAGQSTHVILLNPSDLKQSDRYIQLASPGQAVAFDPSGNLLATSDSQGSVQLWNASSLDEVGPPMEDGSIVYGLAFSPDGASVASGDFAGNVLVWTTTGLPPLAKALGGVPVFQLTINSDSKLLATANQDGSVDIRTLSKPSPPFRLAAQNTALTSAVFAPRNAALLAIGESSGNIALYNTTSRRSTILRGGGSSVNDAVFSPDGEYLAAGYANGRVALWGLKSKRITATFAVNASAGGVTTMAFSPAGNKLAVGYESSGIVLFEPEDPHRAGIPVRADEALYSLAFNATGTVLAASDGLGNVELYDVADLRPNGYLPGDGGTIYGLAISPNGQTLATMDENGNLHLWDLSTRQPLGWFVSTGSAGLDVAFAPDGGVLATTGQGGTILWPSLLWSTNSQRFSADLCPRLGQNLTTIQWNQEVPAQPYHRTCAKYPGG